ncbi:MAG: TetR/AcrR family transcriptional regulator [Solirubrobacteraceae bacterium]
MAPGISRAAARRERESEIVAATRGLFDERGLQDAPIEDVAAAVGINKALIYRHFASKEELFMATMIDYLAQLAGLLEQVPPGTPRERLRWSWSRFIDFCLAYPAFLDCSLSLMRRPAAELEGNVSEGVWMRLGLGMAKLLGPLAALLEEGERSGEFSVADANYTASQLYAQTIGALHLARIGIGVTRSAGGGPEVFPISAAQVRSGCLAATLATVAPSPPE